MGGFRSERNGGSAPLPFERRRTVRKERFSYRPSPSRRRVIAAMAPPASARGRDRLKAPPEPPSASQRGHSDLEEGLRVFTTQPGSTLQHGSAGRKHRLSRRLSYQKGPWCIGSTAAPPRPGWLPGRDQPGGLGCIAYTNPCAGPLLSIQTAVGAFCRPSGTADCLRGRHTGSASLAWPETIPVGISGTRKTFMEDHLSGWLSRGSPCLLSK